MFEKGMNRKGQEGLTLTTLLLIVLGIVVVAVIILGVTGILGKIFSSGEEIIPSKLEAAVQGCKIAAQASLVADYCYDLKKIGDDLYVNCQNNRIATSLDAQTVVVPIDITCNAGVLNISLVEFCRDKKDSVRVQTLTDQTCAKVKFSNLPLNCLAVKDARIVTPDTTTAPPTPAKCAATGEDKLKQGQHFQEKMATGEICCRTLTIP